MGNQTIEDLMELEKRFGDNGWNKYPGDTVCCGHGDYEPVDMALYNEWKKRRDAYYEKWMIDLKKRAADGDLAAVSGLVAHDRLTKDFKKMCTTRFAKPDNHK
ncbi:MAG: hypothetical protein GY853_13255 [PVC group bacterium]|nr:hypothetical protein [PVC group bacterium]